MDINDKLLKPYDPKETEGRIYKKWEDSGFFNPDVCVKKGVTKPDAEVFNIVLPPPNVTGILHMGSALMLVIEDILIRQARMAGKRTLWLPGTDSAAIATQSKVEKDIQKKEGKSRYDLGREELLKRIDVFVEESKTTILAQMRAAGASLDWSRYAYTMDEKRYNAVMEAFVRMYNAGLIYRGNRIVIWDPKGQTTISDDEIVYKEEKTKFYYLKYGPFTIGTTRPETKFGDKYVVMHPDDKRYKEYEDGQKIDLEWINGPITATIVKDDKMDMEFGSGVMTITPAHSVVDFEMAERHKLDYEQIIDLKGILLPVAGEFAGQHIKKAREAIIEKLQKKGLVEKIDENYVHNIATAERTDGIVEPQIMLQWFIDVDKKFKIPYSEIPGIATGTETTLKEIMRRAVDSGDVKITPNNFENVYYNWINNLRPWCISRQIWFGHRIPVWYKGSEIYCDKEAPKESGPSSSAGKWEQDPDVLDTWFSSALWTFSTLGWPDNTVDLKMYHPTSVLETGYDIIFFWVARMILASGFLLGQVPFKNVYLHGLVRDGQGRKISKSLGNNIDPMEMAAKYGMDAVRMSLIVGTSMGADSRISEDKIKAYKHFSNKLWNITRFVTSSQKDDDERVAPKASTRDTEILAEFNKLIAEITACMDRGQFHLAAETLYAYVWHTFADKIIEESKEILAGDATADAGVRESRRQLLMHILETSLKLLHPFMPFVTEELWGIIEPNEQMLMVQKWPTQR
ncbi:MAG: valine--tRNA ligase [Candidatus Paceibacterota bacterium]|jgi:valyl-tRNA synthetase